MTFTSPGTPSGTFSGISSGTLAGFPTNHRLLVFDEVASTNKEAMRLAGEGENGPLWIMARRQTGGRGRLGRRWASLEGNLHASLLLGVSLPPLAAQQLSLVAGLAIHDAVLELHDRSGGPPAALQHLRLKWPNDGLIGESKFAGVLCESLWPGRNPGGAGNRTGADARMQTVTGIGINLARAPEDCDRPVTSLKDHGINADPEMALAALANSFANWLDIWQEGQGFGEIRSAWCQRTVALGAPIAIRTGSDEVVAGAATFPGKDVGKIEGRFAGLDETGALLIETDQAGLMRFTFGDVSLPTAPR